MTATFKIRPVIMSGGAGARLWPMSRAAHPKQFLKLASDKTLFQETLERVKADASLPFLAPAIIGAERHAGLMKEQASALGMAPAVILCEPCPRNTAAVAATAAAWSERTDAQALILLLPADHRIDDPRAFRRAVLAAAPQAAAGRIVTFGIKPARAHTGYGYIERGDALGESVFAVRAFREKPDAETARAYVEGGRHFWNAGIFLFSPQAMLEELGRYAPAIRREARAALERAAEAEGLVRLDAEAFAACPADSIDYAVMEKTKKAAVVAPVDAGWSDIGDWEAISRGGDEENVARIDSAGALILTDGPFVGVIGADDLVVVAAGGAVLVMPKSRAQDVKQIVEMLKEKKRTDLL